MRPSRLGEACEVGGGEHLSFPRRQIPLGITGTCRSKSDLGDGGSSHSSVKGGTRGNEWNLIGAFLPSFPPPNTNRKSQTSSSAASRLPAACSPFRTLTHSNHQLILLHLIFMRLSVLFFFSPPFQYLAI